MRAEHELAHQRTPKTMMNYANYDTQVIQKYQCKIVGWTFNKFISPFDINTVDDLWTLRDALQCGSCFWVRLTKAEVSKHAAEMVLQEKAGEVVGKKRKQRSDKGVKKGSKAKDGVNGNGDSSDDSDNKEEAGPSKRKKTAPQPKPAPKAKVVKVKQTSVDKKGKKKAASKGKGRSRHSSKPQLPPSKAMITDTEDEAEDSGDSGTEME
jgi:hypothetical protein